MPVTNIKWEQDAPGVWIGQKDTLGPTVTIVGGVHGDEPSGIEVIKHSLASLSIDTGTVQLVVGNLAAQGMTTPPRYIETNLNRNIRHLTEEERAAGPAELPYELTRAQVLLPYFDASDALIDFHDFTNPSLPFIICERDSLKTAKAIGAPIISFGWSKTESGSVDGYMHERGAIGLCYELGKKSNYMDNVQRGVDAVSRFLSVMGLVEAEFEPLFDDPTYVETTDAVVREGEDFKLVRDFQNFEILRAGEAIAYEGEATILAHAEQVIIFPMKNCAVGEEAFTLGKIVEE